MNRWNRDGPLLSPSPFQPQCSGVRPCEVVSPPQEQGENTSLRPPSPQCLQRANLQGYKHCHGNRGTQQTPLLREGSCLGFRFQQAGP